MDINNLQSGLYMPSQESGKKNLVRAISEDGSAVAIAIDSTEMVARMEQIHKTSAVVTAGLGRLTTAGSIMGSMLKNTTDTLTLRMSGGGEVGSLIAVADSAGNVKSYVTNPVVELPLNEHGKLDVGGAVGKDGTLQVIKDLGLKEPYAGQVPIISGEIAEDITAYYAQSEQTPTVCSLGVLVNPDLTVKSAGGFMVQLLPFADEGCIEIIEQNVNKLPAVSTMIEEGMTPEDIALKLLDGLKPNIIDTMATAYRCDCSRARVEKALISMGKESLEEMIAEDGKAEVNCHFCPKIYRFNKEELQEILKSI